MLANGAGHRLGVEEAIGSPDVLLCSEVTPEARKQRVVLRCDFWRRPKLGDTPGQSLICALETAILLVRILG